MRSLLLVSIPLLLLACSPSLPPRYVVERDIGDYGYRRYQHVLDVEFRIPGNPGEGHTAAYVLSGQERGVTLATAFVSIYEEAGSLAAEVRERLQSLTTYSAEVVRREREWVWLLEGRAGDRFLLWVSDNHVVKLGAPEGGAIPEALVERYLDLYPSDLDEHGRAQEGAESAGPSQRVREEEEELELPSSLRDGAPR